MRRRDRMEGHIWLDWVGSEDRRKWVSLAPERDMYVYDSMDRLVRHYRLMVVAEQVNSDYEVRCYPRLDARANGLPYFAAAYRGVDVAMCLSAAVYEYDTMQEGQAPFNLTNAEVVRCIV